jgi:hypothetical protein
LLCQTAAPIFAGFIVIAISFGTGWLLNVLTNALFDFQFVAENPSLFLAALIVFFLAVGLLMGFFISGRNLRRRSES